VRMFSGCMDAQTSADVHDVSSFGLPDSDGAGGACTNALLHALQESEKLSWIEVLSKMQKTLKGKRFSQVPQLSTSKKMNLTSEFNLGDIGHGGKRKSLLIGINYVGQQGELRGCHNDVKAMQQHIAKHEFSTDRSHQLVLMDDGSHTEPTAANIIDAFDWLVHDAQAGDALFMHYSGHGGSVKDTSGDEADGMDETMVPVDYKHKGQLVDDDIFAKLVAPLPKGVKLTVVMDCCHSGSILDLPYIFVANQGAVEAAEVSGQAETAPNPNFKLEDLMKVALSVGIQLAQGKSVKDIGMGLLRSLF
jgi:hypothetical protein